MSQDPNGIYARLLLPKGQGFPLWMPDPNHRLPLEYRKRGVSIGDVGIITSDGAFDFLFNICLPPDHAINSNSVPDEFETLELSSRDLLEFPGHYIPGTDIASMSIKKYEIDIEGSAASPVVPVGLGGGLKFVCSTSKGAILVLPEGASREDLANRSKFTEYASKHVVNWYRFINGPLGRETRNGSVYLVTGSDKASSWGVASFSDIDREQGLSLKFTGVGLADGDANIGYSWKDFSPAAVRAGPPPSGRLLHEDGTAAGNQCVFVRGFRVALRTTIWLRRLGKARLSTIVGSKPNDMLWKGGSAPFRANDRHQTNLTSRFFGRTANSEQMHSTTSPEEPPEPDNGVDLERIPGEQQLYHPSDIINQYLLDMSSDTQMAMTHDDDWCGILDEGQIVMPSDEELCNRVRRSYRLGQERGVAFLAPRNVRTANSPVEPTRITISHTMRRSPPASVRRRSRTPRRDGHSRISPLLSFTPIRRKSGTPGPSQGARRMSVGEDESTEAVAVFVDMEDEEITPGDEENAHPRGRQRIRTRTMMTKTGRQTKSSDA